MNKTVVYELVISVIAIISIICILVYLLMGEQDDTEELPLTIEGTVLSVSFKEMYNESEVYDVTLDDGSSYPMLFRTENATVPPSDVTLRFYYVVLNSYYDIYKIKSL